MWRFIQLSAFHLLANCELTCHTSKLKLKLKKCKSVKGKWRENRNTRKSLGYINENQELRESEQVIDKMIKGGEETVGKSV